MSTRGCAAFTCIVDQAILKVSPKCASLLSKTEKNDILLLCLWLTIKTHGAVCYLEQSLLATMYLYIVVPIQISYMHIGESLFLIIPV